MTLVCKTSSRPGGARFYVRSASLTALSLLMLACSSVGPGADMDTEVLTGIQDLLLDADISYDPPLALEPLDVSLQALMPGLSLSDDLLAPVVERFNVMADAENARDFFNNLVAGTDYGVIVSTEVEGQISINLPNVTIDEVMNTVAEIYDFQITRRGNIYEVKPQGMITRIFTIDYLNVSRDGSSSVSITSGGAGGSGGQQSGQQGGQSGIAGGIGGAGSVASSAGGGIGGALGGAGGAGGGGGGGGQVSTQTQTDFWTDIKATLEGILGLSTTSSTAPQVGVPAGSGLLAGLGSAAGRVQTSAARDESGRTVVVQPQVGLVMVTATPSELEQVASYIETAQSILMREVTIQVQFLEVILNKGYQSAIDFDTFGPGGSANGNNTVTGQFGAGTQGVTFDGISNPLTIATNFTDFNAIFRLLESRGTTQVLSSPSLKVLNNQKALFQDGDQEYFQTSVGSNVVNTGNSVTETSANNLQQFFSGISMDITPQISADGTITLHVHPVITTVSEQNKSVAGQQVPLARTSVRELDSIIRAQDGRIVILGGLAYERTVDSTAGIPGLNDVPVVGAAFDQRRQSTVKSEFIILLRPVIATSQSEQNLLRERSERVRRISETLNPFSN
ncbi:MAG: secretin N-terminal domain-containing protein [Pseudohongiella sp.]|nr:secretin N-terminal domain-containing protein [Pseudohongiella sp.]